ncbi:N-ethylmaleimide reductase [Formivibrio citricus]|uniref:N-ethylmaleimide reductase n=1 Tax=Formivibrio citricus TaxID=83765 RepID=A0A1I4WC17_9NEIS|nr:alkene reductase [Formivibrio citricus]SFN11261.1 N-ethylmaleimide reductase [Formivibrio citricus]
MPLDHLFSPLSLGTVSLKNRLIMAPMTRSRAGQPGDVPTSLNAEYYAQRAGAGLIVTEASQISRQGQGYAWTPGIYTDAQEKGWKGVVDAVHAKGGKIALQLWHVGRISHHLLQANAVAPVAPSPVRAENSKSFVVLPDGTPANVPCDEPRSLSSAEIPGLIDDFVRAARRARRAGFDLVEVHAANGYLLNQFLSPNTNQRTDQYGGDLENRARLVLEIIDAIGEEIGFDRIGVRLSPGGVFNDMDDPQSEDMALYLGSEFTRRGLAYLHIAEPDWAGGQPLSAEFRRDLRLAFPGCLIYCGNYTAEKAEAVIAAGIANAIAFGRPFIANPDLPRRFQENAPLNTPDPDKFYGGGAEGYTDYPTL